MSGTPVVRKLPPFEDAPLHPTDAGQFSTAWTAHLDDQALRLDLLPSQMRKGVTDGSDAAAGDKGEYLSAAGSSISLANLTVTNMVSLDLTAGDWDVQGNVEFAAGAGTHNFFGVGVGGIDTHSQATYPSSTMNMGMTTATQRRNVTATTTVWVVAEAGFTGTVNATGTIRARRIR